MLLVLAAGESAQLALSRHFFIGFAHLYCCPDTVLTSHYITYITYALACFACGFLVIHVYFLH